MEIDVFDTRESRNDVGRERNSKSLFSLFFFRGIIARAFDIRKFRFYSKIIHRIRYVCDTMKNIRRSV